jgi:hypothetical protein
VQRGKEVKSKERKKHKTPSPPSAFLVFFVLFSRAQLSKDDNIIWVATLFIISGCTSRLGAWVRAWLDIAAARSHASYSLEWVAGSHQVRTE